MLEAGGNPMAKNDEAHLAAVLSVDVTEVTDKALERGMSRSMLKS